MRRTLFNDNWKVTRLTGGILGMHIMGYGEGKEVTLPHDAMIEEERVPDCANGVSTGFYPGGIYRYVKRFYVPWEWAEKTVSIEFEGAYMNTRVYLNGDYMGGCAYGYSNFYISLDKGLLYGEENEIAVLVNNSAEPNSRWYSGSGLYRNVNLMTGNDVHIAADSVKITTPEIEKNTAVVCVEGRIKNRSNHNHGILLKTEIFGPDNKLAAEEVNRVTVYGNTDTYVKQRITIRKPALWSCETPDLYRCELRILEAGEETDTEILNFGIRKLNLDAENGLRINGKEVKLRGACIHHDNGIIGACTLSRAEERRCRLLKEAGFNCIRSSHHPLSKAMLDACDRLGMLVMDELSDMWEHPKNINDYAMFFPDCWEQDVERMIDKDFNHPCVIMYSTGNEIQEVGTPRGAELNRRICEKMRMLDPSRYTTNAFNGLLASLDYKMEISAALREKASREKKGLNDIMGEAINPFQKEVINASSVHPLMTAKIDEFMAPLDIAGYNYLTIRHEMDREEKPNRVILGTETFPSEIAELWKIVRKNKYVIGDMTWTGYDYLGEAALGLITYDGEQKEAGMYRTAYAGDIDLIGHRRPISFFREIVFGLRKDPYIAVERPQYFGRKPKKSQWAFEDSISSWTWRGYEKKPVIVDVYGDGDEVEVFVNDKSKGRRPMGEKFGFAAKYQLEYEPGEIKAVLYKDGTVCGCYELRTAEAEVELFAEECDTVLKADGQDIVFLTVGMRDKRGNINLQEKKEISICVEGEGILQGYGSADPAAEESYKDTVCHTFDGYVQAAVRSGKKAGKVKATFCAEGCKPLEIVVLTEV